MSDEWFIARNGSKVGPFNFAQMRQMADSGLLHGNEMVWAESLTGWTSAGRVEKLFTPLDLPASESPVERRSASTEPRRDPSRRESQPAPVRSGESASPPPRRQPDSALDDYTDIADVPWHRRSKTVSWLCLGGLLLPPLLWAACVICATGGVYYDRRRRDGTLARWSSANKVAAAIILAVQSAVIISRVADAFAGPEAYDLRGPGVKKGQSFRTTQRFEMRDADTLVRLGAESARLRSDIATEGEEIVEVLDIKNGGPTRVRTTVLKDESRTVRRNGSEKEEEREVGPLSGEVVLSVRGTMWANRLEGRKPTAAQDAALKEFAPPVDDSSMFPDRKVRPGDTWELDSSHLRAGMVGMGGQVEGVSGSGRATFRRVEQWGGEICAVVEVDYRVNFRGVFGGNEARFEVDGRETYWRSLSSGVTLRSQFSGRMRMTGTFKEGGQTGELVIEGPATAEATASVR